MTEGGIISNKSVNTIDLSPLLKVAARLLDLHDSRRINGESAQYLSEERTGLGDGQYVEIAQEVLERLHTHSVQFGEEYSSLVSIQQAVHDQNPSVTDLDIEYVLNVLSRPTELKLLQSNEGGASSHVIGDKETNLVEKAAHIVEFRLSKVGKRAVAIALDNTDITYIEGDVTKLIRAIEAGRLAAALGFSERLLQQLRTEHLQLIARIERASGGRIVGQQAIADLELHRQAMGRAVFLVEEARAKIGDLIRRDVPLTDDVPVGLVKAKINELSAGVVRYGRELTQLAELSMRSATSTVRAPSFQELARQWVKSPPASSQLDAVLSILGPLPVVGFTPTGTDFYGVVKAKMRRTVEQTPVDLAGYQAPVEDQFLKWLRNNQAALEDQLRDGRLSLRDVLGQGLGQLDEVATLNCLVTALTAPDEWSSTVLQGHLYRNLERTTLPGLDVMFSEVVLTAVPDDQGDQST